MQLLKDSRQIPKEKEYMSNKLYSDIIYAWLQVNSYWKEGESVRWIPKKEIKFTVIAEALGITRQTASTRFKKLLDESLGLITFNEEKQRYELCKLPSNFALLIQNGTLSKMVSALNENAISVYVYLFNRYWANDCRPFEFTIDQIKSAIGISVTTKSNNYIIDNILSILAKLELLEYDTITKVDGNQVRTVFQINNMSNEIPDTVTIESRKVLKICT